VNLPATFGVGRRDSSAEAYPEHLGKLSAHITKKASRLGLSGGAIMDGQNFGTRNKRGDWAPHKQVERPAIPVSRADRLDPEVAAALFLSVERHIRGVRRGLLGMGHSISGDDANPKLRLDRLAVSVNAVCCPPRPTSQRCLRWSVSS
jgi:hypothetical protein